MAFNNLTDFTSIINNQIDEHENLSEYLTKAETLIQLALNDDFLEQERVILHRYIWIIHDFIKKSSNLNEVLLKELMLFIDK